MTSPGPHQTFNRLERALYPLPGAKLLCGTLMVGSAAALAAGMGTLRLSPPDSFNPLSAALLVGGMLAYEPLRYVHDRLIAYRASYPQERLPAALAVHAYGAPLTLLSVVGSTASIHLHDLNFYNGIGLTAGLAYLGMQGLMLFSPNSRKPQVSAPNP